MPAPTPENAVATMLAGAGLGLTLGTNVFDGPVRPGDPTGSPSPYKAVFVVTIGGPGPQRTMGTSTREIKTCALQVRVRGDKDDYAGGLALARQVRDAIENASLGAGYLNCYVTVSDPIYIGEQGDPYPEWSIPAEVVYETS